MRLARGVPLDIALAFDAGLPRLPVGRLALDRGLAQLEWSPAVLERRLPVAALHYPPEAGLHAANTQSFHAYLMDAAGEWRLAPAYDLTCAPGPGGEHYLDVEGEGRKPSRAHVETLAARHGINARQVSTIIDEVRAAVSEWPRFARACEVSAASAKRVRDAHARVRADF